ncbi:MAG TPA: SDR family NAD(P)-dependent oxidoreductase [Spirochaetales bacterium]|nr:SDR family NAD(P)-dependent oxidoreductase [Spirochaetales bacterium]
MSIELLAAPMLRGLLITMTGRPVALQLESEGEKVAPSGIANLRGITKLSIDPSKVIGADGQSDEKKLASELKIAFSDAADGGALPKAIELTAGDKEFYYTVTAALPTSTQASYATASTSPELAHDFANSARSRSDIVAGKVALVTGGAQGIGEEIVRGLAASGATVFIADLNFEGARELSDTLNASRFHGKTYPVSVNVTDEKSVQAMFDTVAQTTGGLDLVVSNAGVLKAGSVFDFEEKGFRFVTDVNYIGFFLVSKHAARLLRRQWYTAQAWHTDIVQVNSKSGLEGSNKNGAYAGSKFGSIGLVQSFALELVAYNIKVNAICPGNFLGGPLWMDPVKGLFVQYLESGKVPGAKTVDDVRKYYESKVPMGRGVEGKDLMRALYYVVEQEYETGQALPVTGGQVMLS